jgi:hypothetical protein
VKLKGEEMLSELRMLMAAVKARQKAAEKKKGASPAAYDSELRAALRANLAAARGG